jgi:ubiquitin-like domain-containing CTD phosphatase 1
VNDFDITEGELVLDPKDAAENHKKIDNRLNSYKPKILNDPRPGKKLLVLDIDYTLFDHRSTVERPLELMRPYLHEFLTAAYQVRSFLLSIVSHTRQI